MTVSGSPSSTQTCARNLPQHFNGCTCTTSGSVTAEVEIDLTHGFDTDLVSCEPCTTPDVIDWDTPTDLEPDSCLTCSGTGIVSPGACHRCGGSGKQRKGLVEVREQCTGCGGSGEYYAKRCRVCGGSGATTSRQPAPRYLPDNLADLSDEDFQAAVTAALTPQPDEGDFVIYGSKAGSVRLDEGQAHALRDELRARRATELRGSEGHEDRSRFLDQTTAQLFETSWTYLGTPQNEHEALGHLRRGETRVPNDTADADAAVLSFAQADPKVAQAYVNAHDARIGEIDYFDGNSRPWREKREQAVMAIGASGNPDVRVIAATNAQFVSPVVDVLAADPEAEVRRAIAARYGRIIEMRSVRPQSSSRAWDIDLDQHERALIHDSAFKRDKQGRATVKMLEALTVDPDTDVRRECARSQVFPSKKALKNLATDRDPMVRRLLVDGIERKVVNDDVIEILARDPEDGIREALVASGVMLTDKAKRSIAQAKTDTGPAISQPKEYAVVDGKIVQQVARRKK